MLMLRSFFNTCIMRGKRLVVRLLVVHQFVNSLALINSFVPDLAVAVAARPVRSAPGGLLTRGKGNGTFLESGGGRFFSGIPHPHLLGVRLRAFCRG
jgi:hypothetical protein